MSLSNVTNKIIEAKQRFYRSNSKIDLLAVSKNQSVEQIKHLLGQGQSAFGESYLTEATTKQAQLIDESIEWHYIGPMQSNKAKKISLQFDWVQSLDSKKCAQKLNDYRPESKLPLNVLIQININQEPSKSGILGSELIDFCQFISSLPKLKLRGLMVIPQKESDFDKQRLNFAKTFKLYASIKQQYQLDTLSMGMSADFEAAIAEGATMVRIGKQLFGNNDEN